MLCEDTLTIVHSYLTQLRVSEVNEQLLRNYKWTVQELIKITGFEEDQIEDVLWWEGREKDRHWYSYYKGLWRTRVGNSVGVSVGT